MDDKGAGRPSASKIIPGDRDDREIDPADTRHRGLFLIGDAAAAVAIHDAKAVIERDQIGDRALADDARIGHAAGPDGALLRDKRGAGFARERIEGALEDRGDARVRLAVTGENWFDRKAVECQALATLPVTVRSCAGGTFWVASLSVVSGAPTTGAPVRIATEPASDM